MERMERSDAGGSAMAGGQRFQARVAAWWMARILLGTRLGARFGLVAPCVAERLVGESGDEVDDVRVELSGGARLHGQCKRSLKVGMSEESEWGSVLLQFARQAQADAGATGERRYVLFYEEHNGTLTRIAQLLDRYRSLADGEPLVAAATNARERELATDITSLLDQLAGKYPLAALGVLRQSLLRRVCVAQLRLAEGEADFLSAQDALQYGLLAEPRQAPTAMALLHRCADDLLAERCSYDRSALRTALAEKVSLREGSDYWRDFERLDLFSQDELAAHEQEGRARLRLGMTLLSIERPVLRALLDAQGASFVVVGDAGTGKTGCLIQLARQLRTRGQRVWYWAADSLPGPSPSHMGATLGLQHSWSGLFSEARATGGITLIIDGLDGVRDARAQAAYQKLLIQARGAGVRVVASIRRVEAQYASWLKQCFAREPERLDAEDGIPEASTVLGPRVNALLSDVLSTQELQQVLEALPVLGRALTQAPALRPVIRNLFSLDLLCQMLHEGQEPTALSGISTQAELFERYWERRIQDHPQHAELEAGLTELVEQMVQERALQVAPRALPAPVREVLLSTGLLRHPPPIPGRLAEAERVEFSHHLFFDYAAERLFVRRRRKRLTAELASDDAWPLMLRPSLVLFLRYAWVKGRLDFWELLLELERANVSGLHRLSAYVVIAEEARSEAELDPLMQGAMNSSRSDEEWWTRALKGVAIGAAFAVLPRRFSRGEGAWWLRLAQELVRTSVPELVEACQMLLATANSHIEGLGDEARVLMNAAAILLADERRRQDPWGGASRRALGWICRTLSVAPESSRAFLREILVEEGKEVQPPIALCELANHLGDIARGDARLARWLYEVAFGCWEARTLPGAEVLTKQVAPAGANGEGARIQLSRDFPSFFTVAPEEATRAVLHVARQFSKSRGRSPSRRQPFEPLWLAGQERRLVEDGYWRWGWNVANYNQENPSELLESWRDQLVALARAANGQEVFTRVWSVLLQENDQASLWCQVLAAMGEVPEFLGRMCLELLLSPAILVGRGTHRFARRSMEAVSKVLAPEDLQRIEAVILGIRGAVGRGPRTRLARIKRAKAALLRNLPQEHLGELSLRLSRGFGSKDTDVDEDFPVPIIHTSPRNMKDLLAQEHVDVSSPAHGSLIEVGDTLRELYEYPLVDASEVFRVVREAEARLAAASSSVAPVVGDVVRRYVLEALSFLAHAEAALDDLQLAEMAARFDRALEAPPEPKARGIHGFGAEPKDAQSSAALGLIGLALRAGDRPSHVEALRRVARSPIEQVREVLGTYLWRFLEPCPAFVFETLEGWAEEVKPRAARPGLLSHLLVDGWHLRLRRRDATRADELLKALFRKARLFHAEERNMHALFDLRERTGEALGTLHCVFAPAWVEEELSLLLDKPREGVMELRYVLWSATRVVLPEGLPRKRPELVRRPEIVERAHALIVRILRVFLSELRAYSDEWQPPRVIISSLEDEMWRQRLEEAFEAVAGKFCRAAARWLRALDPDLAVRLRLVPLDEDEEKGDPIYEDLLAGGAEVPLAGFASHEEAMRAWWMRVEPILELLLERVSPHTARALIEGLSFCAHLDAPRTLHWLRRYVEGATSRGTLSEQAPADLAVELLARVFADDDGALAARADFRADYLRALDAYLSMGWPKAVEIALQVETLFRPVAA